MKKYIGLFYIFLIACTNTTIKENKLPDEFLKTFDISEFSFRKGEMLLSDAANDVEIIPLETTDKSIFDLKRIRNIVIGEEDIFINVTRRILRFNRNGKYIQDIGNFGQGPKDFLYCSGLGLDETANILYVASNMSIENKIKSYLYNGEYINTFQAEKEGVWLSGDANHRESRDYVFVNGQHIFRRRLPLPDPSKENWQVMIKDITNNLLTYIYDPAILKYNEKFMQNSGEQINRIKSYWESFSPVLNQYDEQVNLLFEANDTIYEYSLSSNSFSPRYIINTGNRLSFEEMHIMDKSQKYFNNCIILKDLLETRDFLYLIAEKQNYSYLLRMNKETGEIQSKSRKGEIKYAPIMQINYREVAEPEFSNDLCGGVSFYPDHHNEKEWIGVYNPEDLLENIDINELEEKKVKLPDKRNQLVEVLKNTQIDDNPILMIVKLKK